jgi:hypothetical protein
MGLALLASASSCADLKPLSAHTCGNAVVEEGEECDRHAAFAGTTCAAPGAVNECRYVCGGDSKCPSGWGCGQDGVCRNPSGKFEEHSKVDGASRILVPADFDGDGRPTIIAMADDDALGRRIGRIVDPDAETAGEGVQVPAAMASPAVADLDGDKHDDVAFCDLHGIGTLHGNSQHSADFVTYPSTLLGADAKLRVFVIDVLPEQPGDELVAFVDSGATSDVVRVPDAQSARATLASLPTVWDNLTGDVVLGTFTAGSCASLVFPVKDSASVYVVSPCKTLPSGKRAWNEGGAPTVIALPGGATVDGPARVGDVDGDGKMDVVVGAAGAVYVAYGVGDGTFRSAPKMGGTPNAAVKLTLPDGIEGVPLAIADLNGDGAADYVGPTGLAISQKDGTVPVTFKNLSADWDSALVGDFNDDGRPDVVAASSKELNLTFLNNAKAGVFNEITVATDGAPTALAAGDFDGDLLQDIAFSTKGSAADGWSIAFGSAKGGPQVVRRMGSIKTIEQISVGHLPDATGADGQADVVMISDSGDEEAGDGVVFSYGRGDRVMLAPYALRDGGSVDLPLAIATGYFRNDKTKDIVAVGQKTDGGLRMWLVAPGQTVTTASAALPAGFHASEAGGFRYGLHLASGDIDTDDDKLDELVLTGPYGKSSALIVARIEPATGAISLSAPVEFDGESTLYNPLMLADLDGDGLKDVVFKPKDDSATDVMVMWNTNQGFETKSPGVLHLPDGIFAFACINVEGVCQLHVTTEKETYAVTTGKDRTFKYAKIEGLPGGLSIASGDFDGDGLGDLAIGDDDAVHFFNAIPVLR